MKNQTILTIIFAIVAMMWTSNASGSIIINGTTYFNSGSITGEGITGSVHYNKDTKTLTLDNAHISNNSTVLENYDDGLTIVVKGDCSISMTADADDVSIKTEHTMTITGGGTLTINGKGSAIKVLTDNPITVTIDGCTVIAKGDGIVGKVASTLIVRNATVKATGSMHGSICIWGDIQLEGCKIEQPAGAVIGNYGVEKLIMKNGIVVKTEV